MAKVKVEVLGAIIDGKGRGETLSIDERSADYFESIGYVKRLSEKKKDNKAKGDKEDEA